MRLLPSPPPTTTAAEATAGTAAAATAADKAAPPTVPQNPAFTWVHHTDGYHYKKKGDGSFDATPHVKNNNGTYIPYS